MDANLFVSIHCNSVNNPIPFGTETFVMGLTRSKGNLEIAKQENSVILLEKNYKQTYKGFDPKNPETLIGLKILQEDYLDRSIQLASKIESNFKNKVNRKSRGIKQTPLWVLDAAYMPSVLMELGFLSNKSEGKYLNSDSGQENMAQAIASAIISYKKEYFGGGYGQISNRSSKLTPSNFKGLKNVSVRTNNGKFFKYAYGETSDYNQAKKDLKEVKSKGYTAAYIIAFRDGKNVSVKEALK